MVLLEREKYDGIFKKRGHKLCDLCELFKPNWSAYNTRDTLKCKIQEYYKSMDLVKTKCPGTLKIIQERQSFTRKVQKEVIAKEVKKALKKRNTGHLSSNSDSSGSS